MKLELLKGGAVQQVITYAVAWTDGSYAWTLPSGLAEGADYTVRVYSRDDPSIEDVSDAPFTITRPALTVTSPNGGESWELESEQTITWSVSGDVGTEVRIELLQAGALVRVIEYIAASADGSYAWTVPAGPARGR